MYVCMFVQQLALCTHFYPEYHILYTSVCMCVPLWTDLLAVLRDMCVFRVYVCMYVCVYLQLCMFPFCGPIPVSKFIPHRCKSNRVAGIWRVLELIVAGICVYKFLCAILGCMYVCMYVCIPVVTCSVMYSVCTRILGVYVCILCSVTSVVPHATCATFKHVTSSMQCHFGRVCPVSQCCTRILGVTICCQTLCIHVVLIHTVNTRNMQY